MDGPFALEHVLAVASKHPFYSSPSVYPLTPVEVAKIVSTGCSPPDVISSLSKFPIANKEQIYKTMRRLADDDNPQNTYRHNTYISITGGGGSGSTTPLAFFTDIRENRAQRAACGNLMRQLGLMGERDCVLTMHTSGKMYRALDLILTVVEYAGATALPAGHLATPDELMTICKNFRPTIITGDTSQLLRFASCVESTGSLGDLKIDKILYTSEPMSRLQRSYLESVFSQDGTPPGFASLLASAEMGIWAVSNFALTGPQLDDSSDFIFDSRHMIVEVLPFDIQISPENCDFPCTLEYQKVGQLVVTSLQRLRNPLVRYLTGDIGSVHELPASAASLIPGDSEHLRVLRLYGRDMRHSFKWQGDYFEFSGLREAMANPSWGILRWQVVLSNDRDQPNSDSMEIRLMRETRRDAVEPLVSQEALVHGLKEYFCVHPMKESLFHVTLTTLDGFVHSATGNKVVMFVDRRRSKAI